MDIVGSASFKTIDKVFHSVIGPDLVIFNAPKVAVLEVS